MTHDVASWMRLLIAGGVVLALHAAQRRGREIERLALALAHAKAERDRLRVRAGDPCPIGMFERQLVELLVPLRRGSDRAAEAAAPGAIRRAQDAETIPAGAQVWLRRMGRLSLSLRRDGPALLLDPVCGRDFRMLPV